MKHVIANDPSWGEVDVPLQRLRPQRFKNLRRLAYMLFLLVALILAIELWTYVGNRMNEFAAHVFAQFPSAKTF